MGYTRAALASFSQGVDDVHEHRSKTSGGDRPPFTFESAPQKVRLAEDAWNSRDPQYVTLGNLSENPKAFLFLMDYANSRRVKVCGTARVVEGDAALEDRLRDPDYPGKVERVILFTVEA